MLLTGDDDDDDDDDDEDTEGEVNDDATLLLRSASASSSVAPSSSSQLEPFISSIVYGKILLTDKSLDSGPTIREDIAIALSGVCK
uniref:Uncharacterized protein n=1 Tax=Anopheles albimanus TaxID=7167 RepID=A0A182FXD7_ANOAL